MPSSQERPGERRGEMARGILKILMDSGEESLSPKIIIARLGEKIPPTSFEKENVESGAQRYNTNARFISTALVKAGWLMKDRRQWSITEEGQKAYQIYSDPGKLYQEAIKRYNQRKKDQSSEDADLGSVDDEATSSATLEESQENAWAEIEKHLGKMLAYDFQEAVAGLLEGMGHHIYWVAPPGPDGGIDIHAAVGAFGKRVKVQVKRRRDSISVDAIRAFRDTLKEGDTGIFITTSSFTKNAQDEARRGQRHLVLIDAVQFFELWETHYEKIPEAQRRLLPIKRVAFLDLSNSPSA